MRYTVLLSALFLMESIGQASAIPYCPPPPPCSTCPIGSTNVASSNFSSNSEGWLALTADEAAAGISPVLTNLAVTFHSNGGNPGGDISILDPDTNTTFFQAPVSYLSGLAGAYNGTFSFDIKTSTTPDYFGSLLVLKGGGLTLVYTPTSQPVGTQWSTIDIALAPGANWHVGQPGGAQASAADFHTALHNATALWIGAETTTGLVETVSLDNVALCAPASVPEPSTWALVGTAGLLLAFKRRKRA